jgi:flotillin
VWSWIRAVVADRGEHEPVPIDLERSGPDGNGYVFRLGVRAGYGGGTYVRPFSERVQRLLLELMQFDVRTAETYSMHGVPVQVDGVCMVKIDGSDECIVRAAEQFLSRRTEEIVRTAMQAVEGHMRAAIGSHSIEDIYRDRQALVRQVRELAGPDLEAMGLTIVSLTIRNVGDKQGYIEAPPPRTAQVKRDAIRGEAEAAAAVSRRLPRPRRS